MGCGRLRGSSLVFLLALCLAGCSDEFIVSVEPFAVRVVDEHGVPVEGAVVVAAYRTSYGTHAVVDGVLHAVEEETDGEGMATFAGWSRKTTKGFGAREPTLTVVKFGYSTGKGTTRSRRERQGKVFVVSDITPTVPASLTLKKCSRMDDADQCVRDAYRDMFLLLGPMDDLVKTSLPAFAREVARHEEHYRKTDQL